MKQHDLFKRVPRSRHSGAQVSMDEAGGFVQQARPARLRCHTRQRVERAGRQHELHLMRLRTPPCAEILRDLRLVDVGRVLNFEGGAEHRPVHLLGAGQDVLYCLLQACAPEDSRIGKCPAGGKTPPSHAHEGSGRGQPSGPGSRGAEVLELARLLVDPQHRTPARAVCCCCDSCRRLCRDLRRAEKHEGDRATLRGEHDVGQQTCAGHADAEPRRGERRAEGRRGAWRE
mmetsp:Transcript_4636/g.11643  ORF Transcript_4636/g.11643 Transcript_4636/m.11643 type:complete len:230 (+) Transcript_4636:628-1317(+)